MNIYFLTLPLAACIGISFATVQEKRMDQPELPKAQLTTKLVAPPEAVRDTDGKVTGYRQIVEVTNTSGRDLTCFGHGPNSPFYQTFVESSPGNWKSITCGFCGTGATYHRFKNGAKFTAHVFLEPENLKRRVQISITSHSGRSKGKTREFRSAPVYLATAASSKLPPPCAIERNCWNG